MLATEPDRGPVREEGIMERLLLLGIATVLGFWPGVGLAGVTAYAEQQRRREIGIRMALGARRGNVLSVVMKEAAVLVTAGVALGLMGAWAGTRFLAALTEAPVDALRTLFLDDLESRPLSNEKQTGGLVDRAGSGWVVFDLDGTREAARERCFAKNRRLASALWAVG